MKYGYFDDKNREYVITRPDTPLPWINYLGCQAYYGIISNTAGGYSFYRDARLRRITRSRYNNVPLDYGGRATSLSRKKKCATPKVASTGPLPGCPPAAIWSNTNAVMAWATPRSVRNTVAFRPAPATLSRWMKTWKSGNSR